MSGWSVQPKGSVHWHRPILIHARAHLDGQTPCAAHGPYHNHHNHHNYHSWQHQCADPVFWGGARDALRPTGTEDSTSGGAARPPAGARAAEERPHRGAPQGTTCRPSPCPFWHGRQVRRSTPPRTRLVLMVTMHLALCSLPWLAGPVCSAFWPVWT